MEDYAIEMLEITKQFPGVLANDHVTIQVRRGEIHALLGENGAGKSTLMSVLFGLYRPDGGRIRKDGREVSILSPNDANRLGLGMVHQHFKLVDRFTVLENIILGQEPHRRGFLRKEEARRRVLALSRRYGLEIDPDAKVEDIPVGMQQRTEILKMLYRDNDVLIFDEPTAVLTPQEIEELIAMMKDFAREGKSILFITHKLGEIIAAAHRCTVLRKGKTVGTVTVSETSREELSRMMVGREVPLQAEKPPRTPGPVVLSVDHLTVPSRLHRRDGVKNVSFQVRQGEIVCLAGVDGNGQTELISALTGLEKPRSGTITLQGQEITRSSVGERRRRGLGHIPEDRHKHGLILDYTLAQNLILQQYRKAPFQRWGFLRFAPIRAYAARLIGDYDIRASQGPDTVVRSLSGGNQQKAVIARETDVAPALLVAVQPTRGLDVGAIAQIHRQLIAQREEGRGVLLVSLELDEVMGLSDRILVLHQGEIVGELDPKTTTVQELGLYMAGARRDPSQKEDRHG